MNGNKKRSSQSCSLTSTDMAVMQSAFSDVVTQIEKRYSDDQSDREGRLLMANFLSDLVKKYISSGCPITPNATSLIAETSVENKCVDINDDIGVLLASHRLLHLPKKTKFDGVQIVESKCNYPQYNCKARCGRRVRTYCLCSPGVIRCHECFSVHVAQGLTLEETNEMHVDEIPKTKPPTGEVPSHVLESPPKFTGKWNGTEWKKATTEYLQRRCKCGKKTRTYCSCSKSLFYCLNCFAIHLKETQGVDL